MGLGVHSVRFIPYFLSDSHPGHRLGTECSPAQCPPAQSCAEPGGSDPQRVPLGLPPQLALFWHTEHSCSWHEFGLWVLGCTHGGWAAQRGYPSEPGLRATLRLGLSRAPAVPAACPARSSAGASGSWCGPRRGPPGAGLGCFPPGCPALAPLHGPLPLSSGYCLHAWLEPLEKTQHVIKRVSVFYGDSD